MGCNEEPIVEPKIINERDSNFPDMEEWPGERYKGIGIKRMRGYKCSLPIDKLNEKDIPEKKIKLFLYDVGRDTTVEETFSNHDTGEIIKKRFIEETKTDLKEYKIRLFFSGMEIKDNDFIYQHSLEDDFKIQVMKIKN